MSSVIDTAVAWAIDIANDNTHGYSQANRYGPDYDCSSLTITAYKKAGLNLGNASWTGNMYSNFMSAGFKDVTSSVNRNTGSGLEKGDVLLHTQNHTCIYIGNGRVVNARTDTDGRQGDSNGDEIRIQSYWNYPWEYILRYCGGDTSKTETTTVVVESVKSEDVLIPNKTRGIGIAMLQGGLKYLGYNLGWYGIDGDSGMQYSYTNTAVKQAVSHKEISKETVGYLINLCKKGE